MIRNGKMPLENSRFPFKLLKCWSSTLLFIFSSISLLYLLLLWSIESFEALKTRSGAQETHETPLEAVTKVHHVEDEEDFDNQLKNAGDKVVLVDFFATWCMPCVTITPYLDNFAEKYSGRLLILKIDVDELTDLAIQNRFDANIHLFQEWWNCGTLLWRQRCKNRNSHPEIYCLNILYESNIFSSDLIAFWFENKMNSSSWQQEQLFLSSLF